MLRKSAAALAVLGALNTAQVQALGLGEVTVHSALNQPLDAEINLLQIRDLARSQIIAGLADADDFYLAGVKPSAILSDINFQLDVKGGKGVIRLTTSEPIKEPFLNFLVEVNWPSGRLVREYTVLLDPPVFTAKDLTPRAAPALPMTKSAPAETARRQAKSAVSAPTRSGADNIQTRADESGQYFVGVHDTLWNIALKTRPDRSISPQQMMLAIQRLNPDAFINNNINRLRSGVVLNIPSRQQITSQDLSTSVAEVKRQNTAWKGKSPKAEAAAKKKSEQLDAAKSDMAQPGGGESPDQSTLRIVSQTPEEEVSQPEDKAVSVDSESAPAAPAVSDQLMERNQELEEQLVVTLEGLDKVERDNAELFQRMERLTEQLESVQRLLLLKDQQMADLQNQLTEAQAQVEAPVPQPVQKPARNIVDTIMDSPAILGGGVAAIVALLGGLLFAMRRRKEGESDEQAVEQAMAVLEEREKSADPAAEVAKVAAAAVVAEEVAEAVVEQPLEEVAVEEDLDDPFNLATEDEIGDEFDALISEDLDEQLGDDLDMDLKIDEAIEEDPEMAEFAASLLNDEEYDLAVGDDELDLSEVAADEASVPEMEDAALTDTLAADDVAAELADNGAADDELDFILAETADSAEAPEEPGEALQGIEDEDSDLDFIIAETAEESGGAAVADELLSEELDSDGLDSVLAEEQFSADVADALDDQQLDNESGLDTVALDDGDEDVLLEDSALDDLLSQAESQESAAAGEGEEAVASRVSEDLDLSSLDLDSLDLDAGQSGASIAELEPAEEIADIAAEDAGELSADTAGFDIAEELVSDSTDEELPGGASGSDTEALNLGETDVLGDSLDDSGLLDAVAGDESRVDLDAVNELELEAELNQMLEEDGNELALEETDVSESDEELDYLDASDELGTKLDLARAYIDMDDPEGARDILNEVLADGNEQQIEEAQKLLGSLS